MSEPKYRLTLTITTGPDKTPVHEMRFEGRRRAFVGLAECALNLWPMIRLLEKGMIRRIGPVGMTREQWQRIHGKDAA